MRALGFDVKKQDLAAIMKEYDRGETNTIEYADFAELMAQKVPRGPKHPSEPRPRRQL